MGDSFDNENKFSEIYRTFFLPKRRKSSDIIRHIIGFDV